MLLLRFLWISSHYFGIQPCCPQGCCWGGSIPRAHGRGNNGDFSLKRRIWEFFSWHSSASEPQQGVGAFPVFQRSIQREEGALHNPDSGRADKSLSWIPGCAFPTSGSKPGSSQGVGKREHNPRGWRKVKPEVHCNSWQVFHRFPPPWQRNFAHFPRDSRNLIPQPCQPASRIPPEISWHG